MAGFATVVNFWLGSSQGSRQKEERQAAQNTEILDKSAKQNTEVLEKSSKQVAELQTTIRDMVARKSAASEATKLDTHFEQCADIVMAQQDVSHRTADPGIITQFGLTLEEFRTLRGDKSLTVDDLNKLTRRDAREIYRSRYWNVLNCDDLPVNAVSILLTCAEVKFPRRRNGDQPAV